MENISYGKIVLIGAGHVGSAILDSLLRMNLADEIVVINRNEKKALGVVLDASHTTAFAYSANANIRVGTYEDCRDAQIIINTAGPSIQPGNSRDRMVLLQTNVQVMKKIMEPIQKRAEEAEQKSLEEVAKKYELLGTKAEELVPVLKSMKATSDEAYNNFIASMDNNLAVIQKSGLFEEIGKSGGAHTGNDDTEGVAKMNAKVAEIKKSMPNLTDAQAQDIVMQNDPELRAMFDK